jgi:tetratricopeptide (TPR) repeat protein
MQPHESATPTAPAPGYPRAHQRGVEALYAVGHRLLESERISDAANVFRLLLREAPTDERSWLALGLCHERIDQLRIALELYSAGSIVAEPSPLLHIARARMLRNLEEERAARLAYDAAIDCASLEQDDLSALAAHERDNP